MRRPPKLYGLVSLALAALLVLTGCGGAAPSPTAAPKAAEPTKPAAAAATTAPAAATTAPAAAATTAPAAAPAKEAKPGEIKLSYHRRPEPGLASGR